MKSCSKCKQIKPLFEFGVDKTHKDGRKSQCRLCRNLSINTETEMQYRLLHGVNIKNYQKQYRQDNLAKMNSYTAKRKATKLNASPDWSKNEFDKFVIDEIYKLSTLRTKLTGVKHHVDHEVPLQNELVCGLHCISNLRIITAKENQCKGNKTWINMP